MFVFNKIQTIDFTLDNLKILRNDGKNIFEFLESFANLLLRWGRVHNITGARSVDSVWRQIIDSLTPCVFLQPFKVCADIGSGAGFPAILLAIYYADSHFYLLEPRLKCVSFLHIVVSELELKNVSIIPCFSYDTQGIKADLITSRAVCDAPTLMKNSLHLLSDSGCYLLFKGRESIKECESIKDVKIDIFRHKSNRFFMYVRNLTKI